MQTTTRARDKAKITPSRSARSGRSGRSTWEIAELYPPQGAWCEDEYLALETNRRIELSDGYVEFLSGPSIPHELIVAFLYHALLNFARARKLGVVFFAGARVRLWKDTIRVPDIVFVSNEHREKITRPFCETADLVMEVVSESREDRKRDLILKKAEYAKAGISEYWIVDPELRQITVFKLEGKAYAVHGKFKTGRKADSEILKGFSVDVKAALAGLQQ